MPLINPALNVLRGARQVVRVMQQNVQVWPPVCGAFCDFFDRVNGVLGSNWMPGVIRRTGGYDEMTTIEPYIVDHHVEGDEDILVMEPGSGGGVGEVISLIFEDFTRFGTSALGTGWTTFTPPRVSRTAVSTYIVPDPVNVMQWDRDSPGGLVGVSAVRPNQEFPSENQYVQATITNCWPPDVQWNLVLAVGVNLTDRSCVEVYFGPIDNETDPADLQWGAYYVNAAGVDQSTFMNGYIEGIGPLDNSREIVCRVEREGAIYRILVDGVLQDEAELPSSGPGGPVTGTYIGHTSEWFYFGTGTPVGPQVTEFRAEARAALPESEPVGVHLLNDVMTVAPYIGDQFIEIVTDNVHQGVVTDCVTDDFERVAVGPDWVLQPHTGFATATVDPFTINDGALVAPVDAPGLPLTSMRWQAAQGAAQAVEITVSNCMGNNGYFVLFTNANDTDSACECVQINFYDGMNPPWTPSGDDELYLLFDRFGASSATALGEVTLPYPATEPIAFRLESDPDGTQRVFVNGELVLTVVDPSPVSGPYVGVQMSVNSHLGAYDSARIESFSVCPMIGQQSVESVFILYCQANTINLCCTAVWCEYRLTPTGGELYAYVFQQNALGQVSTVPPRLGALASGHLAGFAYPDDPIARLRFEVARDGHVRLIASDDEFTDTVVIEGRVPALTGDRVGFAFMWTGSAVAELPSCVTFTDDFERADGPLGPDWVITSKTIGTPQVDILHIDDGDAVGTVGTGTWVSSARHVGDFSGSDQFIEISISQVGGTGANEYIELYTRLSDDFTNEGAYIYSYYYDPIPMTYGIARYDGPALSDWWDITGDIVMPVMPPDPLVLRLESYLNGDHKFFINGELLATGNDSTYFGPYVGFSIWDSGAGDAAEQPRIHYASGGCLQPSTCVTFSDDFERADGPVGPNWVLGQEGVVSHPNELFVIQGGAAVVDKPPDAYTDEGSMNWAVDIDAPDQFIEVVIADIWQESAFGWDVYFTLYNFLDMTVGTRGSYRELQIYATHEYGIGYLELWVDTFTGTTYTSGGFESWDTYPSWETNQITLRLESYGSGRQVGYLDGVMILDYTDTVPLTGISQGINLLWRAAGDESGSQHSPRILSITGGCLEPSSAPTCVSFGEDWVGSSAGPLDPADWVAGGPTYEPSTPMPVLNATGQAIHPTLSGPSVWAFTTIEGSGDASAEIQISTIGSSAIANWVGVSIHFDIDTMTGVEFNYAGAAITGGNLRRTFWVDGDNTDSTVIVHLDVTPVQMRVEAVGSHYTLSYSTGSGFIVVDEFDDDTFTGTRAGMRMRFDDTNVGAQSPRIDGFAAELCSLETPPEPPLPTVPGTSPHILEVCGGCADIEPYEPRYTGDILFVLDWAVDPADLDFHMSGPVGPYGTFPFADDYPVPGRFHANYYQEWPVFHAWLDYDDVSSYGPEYMMIFHAHPDGLAIPPSGDPVEDWPPEIYESPGYVPGEYAVWVHLYSGLGSFATSDAVMRMYQKPDGVDELNFDDNGHLVVDLEEWELVDTFNVSEASGDLTYRPPSSVGVMWHICDLTLTEDTYTWRRVMRIIEGTSITHVLPD